MAIHSNGGPPQTYRDAAQDLVVIGDSITAGNSDTTNNIHADAWPTHMVGELAGRLRLVRNSGIGGNTTAQMLARFDSDVMAYLPNGGWVGIAGGTNDTDGVTDTYPNVEAMINRALVGRCKVFLCSNITQGCPALAAPTITATGSTSGGTLAAATYSYRVAALNLVGTTLASVAATGNVASGTTGSVAIEWAHAQGATSYKIYGRTAGSELLIATNTLTTAGCRYVDTGAVTPSGALPGANTTAVARDGTLHTKHAKVRNSLMRLARKYGLPLVDFHAINADSGTGLGGIYLAGASTDGTHPTFKYQRLMGVAAANALSPYLAPISFIWPLDNGNPAGLTGNALLQNNDGTDPTGWSPFWGTSTMTTDAGVSGAVLRLSSSNNTPSYLASPSYATFATGDKLAFFGKMRFTGADAAHGFATVGLKFQPGTITPQFLSRISISADTDGWLPFYFEALAPAAATSAYIESALSLAGTTAGGTVTLDLAQCDIMNLTTLGLA